MISMILMLLMILTDNPKIHKNTMMIMVMVVMIGLYRNSVSWMVVMMIILKNVTDKSNSNYNPNESIFFSKSNDDSNKVKCQIIISSYSLLDFNIVNYFCSTVIRTNTNLLLAIVC